MQLIFIGARLVRVKEQDVQAERNTRGYRAMLMSAVIAISYLATTSSSLPVIRSVNDKIEHAFAFFTLALLVDFSWPETGFRASKFLPLFAYGLAIEIVQYFLAYRSCSFFDLMADAVGILLYWFSVPLLKDLALFRRRWTA